MKIEEIDELNKNIKVAIPLTGQTSKTRVKSRDIWYGYGYPVATRQKEFELNSYIEWQIGYDIVTSEKTKLELSTLQNKYPSMTECSMGMSQDYPIAIKEGSTMLRIGSALFNEE